MFDHDNMYQMYFQYMFWLFCQQQTMLLNSMQKMMQDSLRMQSAFMSCMDPAVAAGRNMSGITAFQKDQGENAGQPPASDAVFPFMQKFMDPGFLLEHADLQKLLQIDVSPENLEKLQRFLEFFFDICSKYRQPR